MPTVNPALAALGMHPFPRLARLLADVAPPEGLDPIDLTIGEPRVPPPVDVIDDAVVRHGAEWSTYPPNDGSALFRRAARTWLERRNRLPPGTLADGAVVPTAGAREALFHLGLLMGSTDGRRAMGMPTPQYAPYRGAAAFGGLQPFHLPALPEYGYLPQLEAISEEQAQRLAILVLCSPSNPEGAVASAGYLRQAVELARRHDFLLVVDECYSEIYSAEPPMGALEVCLRMCSLDSDPFRNVLVVHSLSKRSSAAGLRVGFVAGDTELVRAMVALRSYAAGTTPLPNLAAAADLLADEEHVLAIRERYRVNADIAAEVLGDLEGFRRPPAGMFLWLRVPRDEDAAVAAWERAAVRIMPGGYLGPPAWDGTAPGREHVRVALVEEPEVTRLALTRLLPVLTELAAMAEVGP